MAKKSPMIHMMSSQEIKWNTAAAAAAMATTGEATAATSERQHRYDHQQSSDSTLFSSTGDVSSKPKSNTSSHSDGNGDSCCEGHEVIPRSTTVISATSTIASHSAVSTDSITTGDFSSVRPEEPQLLEPLLQKPQVLEPAAASAPEPVSVSTDTADQVLLAIAEIESYIDLTRQQSTVWKEEEEVQSSPEKQVTHSSIDSSSSQIKPSVVKTDMLLLTKAAMAAAATSSYQPLPVENDVFGLFQEEKKEDDISVVVRVASSNVPKQVAAEGGKIENNSDPLSLAPNVLPFDSLPAIDETEEEEGEEVVAPAKLFEGGSDVEKKATIVTKGSTGRPRFEGIFGLSMASVRNINRKGRYVAAKDGTSTKLNSVSGVNSSVQYDGAKNDDVEIVQGEETSVCTFSTGSSSSASGFSKELVTSKVGVAPRTMPTTPTANLSLSYETLQMQKSSLRTTISVAQSSNEAYEIVSGEAVSHKVTSPSETMSRRSASRIPSHPPPTPTSLAAFPPPEISVAPSEDMKDAMALAILRRVASSNDKTDSSATNQEDEGVENPYGTTERMNILRSVSSYSSSGGGSGGMEQSYSTLTKKNEMSVQSRSNITVEHLEDTIELTRTKTIRPDGAISISSGMSSFEETEEPLKVKVQNKDNVAIEILRTPTNGSIESNEGTEPSPSVHSSTATIPMSSKGISKIIVQDFSVDESVEIRRSASVLENDGKAAKKLLRVTFQDNEKVVELVRDSSTGQAPPEGSMDLKSVDSCDTICSDDNVIRTILPVNIENNTDSAIEIKRPGSSSSLFSRNAVFHGPQEKELPPPCSPEKAPIIMAHTGSYNPSVRSGASSLRNIRFMGAIAVEEIEETSLKSMLLDDGPTFVSHDDEVPLAVPQWDAASIQNKILAESQDIKAPMIENKSDESKQQMKGNSETVYSASMLVPEASANIPRLPAPKKDTTPVHVALEENFNNTSKWKRQFFKPKKNKVPMSDSTSSVASTAEVKVVVSDQKGVEVAPEDEFPDPFLCTPEHMVHVNVLGVAGIVVDRDACDTAGGAKPAAPEEMKLVVGITERGSDHVNGVTNFSKTLIPSPNGKTGDGKHRHVAVWASNNDGMTPGSLISSDLITLERVDPENPKSRYKPRFFDLIIALAKAAKSENHIAVPIGVAKLKVNGDFASHGEMITMDLPVYTLSQSQKLNEMNATNGETPEAVQYIKLKTKDAKKSGIKGIFQRNVSSHDGDAPTEHERNDLSAAYAIDPTGDSMIRVQVRVETLGIEKDESPELVGDLMSCDDPCDETVATDPTANDSLNSSRTEDEGTIADDTELPIEGNDSCELLRKTKTQVVQLNVGERALELQSIANESLYSEALESPGFHVQEAGTPVKTNSLSQQDTKKEESAVGLRIFGKAISLPDPTMAAKRLDDEIEQVAGTLFGQKVPFSKTTPRQDSDGNLKDATNGEEESFLVRDGSLYASLSGMGDTAGPIIGPVPSVLEIRKYIREQFGMFALRSGEFFFPEDPNMIHDDSSSVGDATLEAFMNGQLRVRTMDSRSWKKSPQGDDDSRTDDTNTTYESEPTISLRPFGETEKEKTAKTPMATVEEETPIDPPTLTDSFMPSSEQTLTLKNGAEDNDDQDDDATLEDDNDGDDEMSFRTPPPTKRSSSRSSSSQPKSVTESMVGSLVEALARYPLCGAGYLDPAISKKQRMKVPATVDPDLMSVGDLTAATLEQHHRRAEAAKQAAHNKSSRSGKKPSLFAPLQAAAFRMFACSTNADNVDDSVIARRSTPIQFTQSGSSTMLKVAQSNSVLSATDVDTDPGQYYQTQRENYFAEYEDFSKRKRAGATTTSNTTSLSPRPAAFERRVDPPADPPANRLTDDEKSTLAGGGASTVFSNSTARGNKGGEESTTTATSLTNNMQKSKSRHNPDLEWEKDDDVTTITVGQHEDDEC